MPFRRERNRTTNPSGSADSVGDPANANDILKCLVETSSMDVQSRPSVEQARRLSEIIFDGITNPVGFVFVSEMEKILNE
ncbi:hypothetical protein FNV43_RR27332 [Rhamnella rubrinervis]|uniref:Uncharacterized protein n=1 Tax=Rhamnella rubrinervis TaxID=2594499 RepID=A0A8K0DWP7_9ROSA|nr:hypothetical protein FNV43_RR27332 [Rhamnella rubrinervis]